MTWLPKDARWRKWYKKNLFYVSCETLGVPPNKMDSYRAANAWWIAKKTELDGILPARKHPIIQEELERRRDWARQNDPELAEEMTRRIGRIDQTDDDEAIELALTPDLDERLKGLKELGVVIPDTISRVFLDSLLGDGRVFKARHSRPSPQVPPDRTAGAQFRRYLAGKMVEARADNLSVSEVDLIRLNVGEFVAHLGEQTPIDAITPERWTAWWNHVIALPLAIETRKKRYRYARAWVWSLVEEGLIPMLHGLRTRRRFKGGARSVPTMTVDEVRTLIDAAPGQLKLHLLLMANTGMTQIDISDLRLDEVDWVNGRIIRRRSKTDDHPDVPTVDYKLWPVTFELLRKYRQPSGERALLTVSGRPWVRDFFRANGKRSKVDSIKSNYVHVQKRLKFDKSMKLLRKTSATLIGDQFATLFLGHSPRSMKDRHYTPPNKVQFDAAVLALGQTYGFGE